MQQQIIIEKFLSALKAGDVDAATGFVAKMPYLSVFGPNPSHQARYRAEDGGKEHSHEY
ncbi:hypothetical protein [Chelativorans sp. YIM 93263]|uniref:hypothetical protein n=1 Tax=Chelativorans sp. YIM 93263 TaxID=2906648 RepID=UPI002379B184|nr:hypothetical protein [Chelativorans sp. YIM 93263]